MYKVRLLLIICLFYTNIYSVVLLKKCDSMQVLKIVQKFLPLDPVIIEAGAFDGADSIKMSNLWPNSIIYSFEPDPRNFKTLAKKTKNIQNINIYPFALSDREGFSVFYQASNLQSGSILAPKEHLKYAPNVLFNDQIEIPIITIDSWAKKYEIRYVDFLWLDMQGAELLALKASPNILKNVKVIFTEVEFVEAYKEQDVYNNVKKWLEEQGFTLIAQDFAEVDVNVTSWYGNILMARTN